MENGVQRTDSQKSQNNNGPRVSFNRDVHVKRIGPRPIEFQPNYPNQQNHQPQNLRRELPDLSSEGIRKEAELVLAQAESVKCRAKGSNDITGGRVNIRTRGPIDLRKDENKFNSLPTRKKKETKPVSRSVSDVSGKKSKKPTIFSIFSRKSDTNLDQIDSSKKEIGKKIGRSKSDVGQTERKIGRKRNNSENDDIISSKKKTQLSPIIEAGPKEDYFERKDLEEIADNKRRQSKEDINIKREKRKDEEIGSNLLLDHTSGNIGYTNQEDLDLVPSKPIAESIKEVITNLSKHSKSTENMHSSQKPTIKPPLTKGLAVDGMIKRLSMERFSPPPHFNGPAFSYTRPNEQQIIYAQVVCDNDGKNKQTIHSSFLSKEPHMTSSSQNIGSPSRDTVDAPTDYNRNGFASDHHSPQKINIIHVPQTKESFRNNSDEDEGLGFEIKREPAEDLIPTRDRKYSPKYLQHSEDEFKSLTEDLPITPNIRNVPPEKPITSFDIVHRGRADGMDAFFPEFQDLSNRREMMETRLKTRRMNSREMIDEPKDQDFYRNPMNQRNGTPERPQRRTRSPQIPSMKMELIRDFDRATPDRELRSRSHDIRELSPDRDLKKFHRFGSREVLNRYSPQRTHLDMISSPRPGQTSTSKYVQETKTYHDGNDGFKETYKSETKIGVDGKPHTTESRIKEKLKPNKEIDLGFQEDSRHFKYDPIEPDTNYFQQKYRQEHEPKSLDSQFSDGIIRSSPEQMKHIISVNQEKYPGDVGKYVHNQEQYNTLTRQQKNQRSFDKGDSGIENDYRKDSFNGEFQSRWRKRTTFDDIKSCEQFLKKERSHTDSNHLPHRNYNYRERSIDDGSHFDPRLDKYPSDTLRRRDRSKSIENEVIRNDKKISGLEKVKQLFTGSSKKKSIKKTDDKKEKDSERFMVREEEMRARYREHRGTSSDHLLAVPKSRDISTRRRLSTPKASPLPKRTPSQKSKSSSSTQQENIPQKLGWFKSIDRLSRKKNVSKIESAPDDDLRLKPKPRPLSPRNENPPTKNLRFFGDTDMESNPSLSKAAWKKKTREPLSSSLSRTKNNHSQSAYDLDTISKAKSGVIGSRHKSTSLQHLEDKHQNGHRYNARHESRSRNLHDISESLSASENEQSENRRGVSPISNTKLKSRNRQMSTSDRNLAASYQRRNNSSLEEDVENEIPFHKKKYMFEEAAIRSQSRELSPKSSLRREKSSLADYRKPPPAPPKPARTMDRRRGVSRERERVHDSSGTEGDSSQQSQRSVVFLHATTVGEIPQPYVLNSRRKAISREDMSSVQSRGLQPMSRTVSRSVSVLAPWKPKHLREGYEINYSQSNERARKFPGTYKEPDTRRSTSTLSKSKKDATTLSRTSRKSSKDELSSEKSSLKSSQKSTKQEYPTITRNVHVIKRDEPSPRRNNKENSVTTSGTGRRRWNQ